ncbi:MAG: 50S ribosomal protein L25/general stress protein Ctc [Proteobacteria bacterium]|nr:50S ribosomal protein L25/general stress protein Ctc [Pseudomonadota bacterium]
MSTQYELNAEKRDAKGTGASRRLRHASKIPAVMYGGGKEPEMLSFDHDTIYHLLENEGFHSSILTVKTDGGSNQAILRDVQMHPFKTRVAHLDLQRISATEKIHMSVPVHCLGTDVAPGVKLEDGMVAHLLTETDVACLPKDLPEYLEVDMSSLHMGDSVHLSDIKLPDGVELTVFSHGGDDLAVATIAAVRGGAEEVEEVEAAAEGEAAEGEAAAEGGESE